jgi:hypothetical protein
MVEYWNNGMMQKGAEIDPTFHPSNIPSFQPSIIPVFLARSA